MSIYVWRQRVQPHKEHGAVESTSRNSGQACAMIAVKGGVMEALPKECIPGLEESEPRVEYLSADPCSSAEYFGREVIFKKAWIGARVAHQMGHVATEPRTAGYRLIYEAAQA
jgi:hypothetical protein